MSPIETAISDLERNWSMVDRTLEEVDDMGLGNQPNGQSNSIGWLLWHMSRVVNRFIFGAKMLPNCAEDSVISRTSDPITKNCVPKASPCVELLSQYQRK